MTDQNEFNNKITPSLSSNNSDDLLEPTTSPLKAMIVALGILGIVFSIFTLLPMFFTLLSDGDFRAPAEIHPTDTATKLINQNEHNNLSEANAYGTSNGYQNDHKESAVFENVAKKYSNNVE
jgi:hypothetical protein